MLGAHHEERRPEERVGPGREDFYGTVACNLEPYLGALGAADPVPLQRLDPLGPIYLREVEELFCVLRDPEKPLRQVLLDNLRPAPFAPPVGPDDLLPRERRVVLGTPVYGRFFPVG
jgi:hypothetical protein